MDWYSELIEDCKSIITEAVFISHWALVEGYHNLGKRILEDKGKYKNQAEFLQGLAKDLSLSQRTLYYAVEFVTKYPDLDTLPEGKNITWNKIITKYLPDKTKPECNHIPITVCKLCRKVLDAV